MTRRQFIALCTVTAGAVITGCAPRGANGSRVTLTQWYHEYGQQGTQEAVLRYAAEYTRSNPHVSVEIVWVPGDYGTKLATALLTSGGPDIFEGQLTVPMVTAEQVAPLDDLFTDRTRADFLPQDLAMNTVGGRIYGVKSMDDTGVLYYRPSMLRNAGIDAPRTSAEMLAAIKALTNPQTKGLYLGNDGGISALLTILPWSAGSDFLVGNEIVFDNPRTAAAYQVLRDINSSGALLLGAPTDWWEPSALTQGLAAMQWSGLWAFPQIRDALKDDIGVSAWPALDEAGQPATFLGGWSTMVNAQGRHVEEAKRYVKWLWIDNKQAQRDWCLSYGFHVPPRVSVARSAEALHAPLVSRTVNNVNEHGRFLPPGWSASMNSALTDAVSNIVKNGAPTESEVALAAANCRRELGRELE
jgi:multiple sugar transport system substrate-binding protein